MSYKMLWAVEITSNCGVQGLIYTMSKDEAIGKLKDTVVEDYYKMVKQHEWKSKSSFLEIHKKVYGNGMNGYVEVEHYPGSADYRYSDWIDYRVKKKRIAV